MVAIDVIGPEGAEEDGAPLRRAPEFFIHNWRTLLSERRHTKKSTRELSEDVEAALLEVRETIRDIHTQGIVLDAFWMPQDSLPCRKATKA